MSHNIDFVTFLMNQHNIPIDVNQCINYENIQAFFIHYDQSNDIEGFIAKTCYLIVDQKTIFSALYKITFSLLPKILDKKYQGLLNSAKAILIYDFDSHDVDFNFIDDNGKTILHHAAEHFHFEWCDYIFDNLGPIVNKQDNEGKTALHYAAINDNIEFLNELLYNNINSEIRDDEGKTALHYAAESGIKSITKQLLCPFDNCTEICDDEGKLPLHYAVISGNVKTALALIERTSRIRKRDNNSKFPLQYAVDDPEMFKKLIFDPKTRNQYYEREDALECNNIASQDVRRIIYDLEHYLWYPGDD
ncbi:ankyrin repeat protein, putative [Trichomonas vaginalis G3]|uniref:Ankyrin repeat protein, putative n=1 Tax=Trichomonas vaginalis (strain ATCC PRA-98 / G3) TaxID=412133 RepID=A2DHW4_TRIV3|nr:proteasome regulatory particle assembly [Trichomonas vaginalis G3]EAY19953.1 ankyrin repeat protein, putative [Trichomonas vaginalis G3]KAI5525903.1 proteasome regulatory particle assembly [Trichomonas vaginalis G3]|eukprot:XP_001580939.1 ankyrin repeat protein [Trichomonas vaginalis G3]